MVPPKRVQGRLRVAPRDRAGRSPSLLLAFARIRAETAHVRRENLQGCAGGNSRPLLTDDFAGHPPIATTDTRLAVPVKLIAARLPWASIVNTARPWKSGTSGSPAAVATLR